MPNPCRRCMLQHDSDFKLGFVANKKRFNVATTRAKALLIVVGNPHVLYTDPCWRELLDVCRDTGACAGAPIPNGAALPGDEDAVMADVALSLQRLSLRPRAAADEGEEYEHPAILREE